MVVHQQFIGFYGKTDVETLQRYLYGSTQLLKVAERDGIVYAVLVVEGVTNEDSIRRAEYQQGRLQSGLYVAHLCTSAACAEEWLYEEYSVDLGWVSPLRRGESITTVNA